MVRLETVSEMLGRDVTRSEIEMNMPSMEGFIRIESDQIRFLPHQARWLFTEFLSTSNVVSKLETNVMSNNVTGLKTWSKLAKNKRRPSEYEIVTTNLQTRNRHRDQAYDLSPAPDLAMNDWYRKYVFDSNLQHDDWEEFRDPDEMIYRNYTRTQDSQEEYIDGVLSEHNDIGHDEDLSAEWLNILKIYILQEDSFRSLCK